MTTTTRKRKYNGDYYNASRVAVHEQASSFGFETPRPPVPPDAFSGDLHFRIDDVVYENKHHTGPRINLFGVTEHGNSINVMVDGFEPYFCLQFPNSSKSKAQVEAFLNNLEEELLTELCLENHIPLANHRLAPLEDPIDEGDSFGYDDDNGQDYEDVGYQDPFGEDVARQKRYRPSSYTTTSTSVFNGRAKLFESFLDEHSHRGLIRRWNRFEAFPSKPYRSKPHEYLRVSVAYPALVAKCRKIIEKNFDPSECSVNEADVDFVLRFMADMEMYPEEWWTLRGPACSPMLDAAAKQSHCQLECRVRVPERFNLPIALQEKKYASSRRKPWGTLHRCEAPGYANKLGEKLCMSTDFEMNSPDGTFPKPEENPIIQATAVFAVHSDSGFQAQTEWINYVFTLGKTDKLKIDAREGTTHLLNFPFVGDGTPEGEASKCSEQNAERKLLAAFQRMVVACDPDVVTSYNGNNFDLPYFTARGQTIGVAQFPYVGKLKSERSHTKKSSKSSRAYGQIDSHETRISGRVQVDMLDILRKGRKFRSYKLGAVSAEIIGDQKDDVSYHEIPIFQKTSTGRRKIAIYCLKDSQLVLYIVRKLISLVEQIQLAKTTGIVMQSLLRRGTQFRNRSLMLREAAHNREPKPPDKRKQQKDDDDEDCSMPFIFRTKTPQETAALMDGEQYTGAIVIRSRSGYYTVRIITLDFSSLYPSIMRAHNFCPTTYVDLEAEPQLTEDDYFSVPDYEENPDAVAEDDEDGPIPMFVNDPATGEEVPNLPDKFRLVHNPDNPCFVHPHVRQGLTPRILTKLIGKRNEVKKLMAAEPEGTFMHDVYDFMQQAIKVCANSLYGLFGAPTSFATLIHLAESVTRVGRGMLLLTQYKAEYCFVHFLRWLLYEKMGYTEEEKPIGLLRNASQAAKSSKRDFYSGLRANAIQKKQTHSADASSVAREVSESKQIRRSNKDIKRIVPKSIPSYVLDQMIYAARLVKSWRFCARIVYGDTDSVFAKMMNCEGDDAILIGVIMTKYITLFFQAPNSLEFEKEFLRILLMKKKKYAGKKRFYAPPRLGKSADEVLKPHAIWEDKKVSKSGVEAVRRDNCKLVSDTISKSLDILLESEQFLEPALKEGFDSPLGKRERQQIMYRYVQAQIRRLRHGQVPFSQLIISKNFSKSLEAYTTMRTTTGALKDPPGHIKLVMDLQRRANLGEPVPTYNVGERVPYVVVEFDKQNDKISNAYRDPLDAWKSGQQISFDDYADNQLCRAMSRIMAPFFRAQTHGMDEKRAEEYVLSETRDILYSADIIDHTYGREQRIENMIRYRPNTREHSHTLLDFEHSLARLCAYCRKSIPKSDANKLLCRECAHADTGDLVLQQLREKFTREQTTRASLMHTCNECFSKRYGFQHSYIVNHCQQTECDTFWDRSLNARNQQHYGEMLKQVMHDRKTPAPPIRDMEDLF